MISVIMPCRNGMPFLPWAVHDLASSSTKLEILVCDDGSNDGSAEWLKELQESTNADADRVSAASEGENEDPNKRAAKETVETPEAPTVGAPDERAFVQQARVHHTRMNQ